MAGRKKQLMSWLGTGTNAKDVGTSISYVYDAVDENDELIDLTLSLQADAAVQFWLDQKQSKQGERTIFIAMHGEIVASQRNLGPFSRQSNESHAYPSGPFIAMSYFISFEPLIIPVYDRCICLFAVLLSTRHSHHDPLLTLTRSHMKTRRRNRGRRTASRSASCR